MRYISSLLNNPICLFSSRYLICSRYFLNFSFNHTNNNQKQSCFCSFFPFYKSNNIWCWCQYINHFNFIWWYLIYLTYFWDILPTRKRIQIYFIFFILKYVLSKQFNSWIEKKNMLIFLNNLLPPGQRLFKLLVRCKKLPRNFKRMWYF